MAENAREKNLVVKGFELLSLDKIQRALDKLGEGASEEAILAEYDKLGGAIRKDGRKLQTGAFFDFEEKKPKENVDYEKVDEEQFEDQFVLVKKPVKKKVEVNKESLASKLARIKRAESVKVEDGDQAPRRGRPKKIVENTDGDEAEE